MIDTLATIGAAALGLYIVLVVTSVVFGLFVSAMEALADYCEDMGWN